MLRQVRTSASSGDDGDCNSEEKPSGDRKRKEVPPGSSEVWLVMLARQGIKPLQACCCCCCKAPCVQQDMCAAWHAHNNAVSKTESCMHLVLSSSLLSTPVNGRMLGIPDSWKSDQSAVFGHNTADVPADSECCWLCSLPGTATRARRPRRRGSCGLLRCTSSSWRLCKPWASTVSPLSGQQIYDQALLCSFGQTCLEVLAQSCACDICMIGSWHCGACQAPLAVPALEQELGHPVNAVQ